MQKVTKFVTVAGITLSLAASALAGPAKKPAKPAAKAPMCAVCNMPLSAKKTKMNTVAVKVKGKTMYCCAKCKMPAPVKTGGKPAPKAGAKKS